MKIPPSTLASLLAIFMGIPAHGAPAEEMIVEALVDQNSELHVRRETVSWECTGTKVGQWNRQNEPIYINGVAWKPRWSQEKGGVARSSPYSISLNTIDLDFELLAVTKQRGETGIERRTPITARVEGGHFVIRIQDPEGGARWYKFAVRKKKT